MQAQSVRIAAVERGAREYPFSDYVWTTAEVVIGYKCLAGVREEVALT